MLYLATLEIFQTDPSGIMGEDEANFRVDFRDTSRFTSVDSFQTISY